MDLRLGVYRAHLDLHYHFPLGVPWARPRLCDDNLQTSCHVVTILGSLFVTEDEASMGGGELVSCDQL